MSSTTTNLVTIEEFEQHPLEHVELVRGEIVEMPPPGGRHGAVCSNVSFLLALWSRDRVEFIPLGNDCGLVTGPDTVRGVDAMVVRRDRFPDGELPVGSVTIPPELTVEVKSPSNTWSDLVGKASEYLNAGTVEVWIVDPDSRHVHVYTRDDEPTILDENNTLSSGVLPEFTTPVAEFFRGL